jgi:hypothetical protein
MRRRRPQLGELSSHPAKSGLNQSSPENASLECCAAIVATPETQKIFPSKTPGIFVKFVKDKSGQLANRMILLGEDGAPGTIRTPDPQIDVAVRFRGVGIARPNGPKGSVAPA